MAQIEKKPIEYESVTIDVPKQIMELLRFASCVLEESPKEWIKYTVVEGVRADLEENLFVPDAAALAKKFNLNPVLEEILNDPVPVE